MEQPSSSVPQPASVAPVKKSKKWIYIGAGIVVVIILGWLLTRSLGTIAKKALESATGGKVQTNADGSHKITTDQGSVEWGSDKKPDNWPTDVTIYEGAKIQSSVSANPATGKQGMYLVLTTGDSQQTVLDFYKKDLVAKGWTVNNSIQSQETMLVSASKDNRVTALTVVRSDEGTTTITIATGTK